MQFIYNSLDMMENKIQEIKDFCSKNADPAIVEKYSKYFKGGYNGYGIESKVFDKQKDKWLEQWSGELTVWDYLDLGDKLVESEKLEEVSFAIHFMAAQKAHFSPEVFKRVGKWLENGISNWANTDVLCMLVLSEFVNEQVIELDQLKQWTQSSSMWKRRAVPVTLVQVVKSGLKPAEALPVVTPLMEDESEDVQKGIGTLLRELWKKYPKEIEAFLLEWKDRCGRLIVRYATEKMDKEQKKRFKKQK